MFVRPFVCIARPNQRPMVASLAPGRRVSILSLKTRYSNNDHDDDDDNMARKKLLLYLLLFVMKQIAQLRSEQKTRHVAQLEILLYSPPPQIGFALLSFACGFLITVLAAGTRLDTGQHQPTASSRPKLCRPLYLSAPSTWCHCVLSVVALFNRPVRGGVY